MSPPSFAISAFHLVKDVTRRTPPPRSWPTSSATVRTSTLFSRLSFKRVLARESLSVGWRQLAMTYRRLEARGEIRGGRFVSGMSGEQFALPEAVGQLRAIRREGPRGQLISISAADPLIVAGVPDGVSKSIKATPGVVVVSNVTVEPVGMPLFTDPPVIVNSVVS